MTAPPARSQQALWVVTDDRRWTHIRVDVDVVKTGVPAIEFAVYSGIVAHAELGTGKAHPSAKTIASYFSLSERRVRSAIDWLESHDLLAVEERLGKSSVFRVLPPPPTLARDAALRGAGDAGVPRGCGTSCKGVLHHVPGTPAPGSDEQDRAIDENGRARVDELRAALRVVR